MRKKKTSELKILDDSVLDARVFRVAEMLGGACSQDLWCRAEVTGMGWMLSFYESRRDAMTSGMAMIAIPTRLFALVELAITKLQDAHEVLRRAFPMPSPDDKMKPLTPSQSSANAAASNSKPVDPLTKAFTDGQEACRTGKELKHCPHPSATPLALKWIEGFEAEKPASQNTAGKA